VSHQTFELYVKEVILSATYHGAKKVIVVNGHGMNRFSLKNIQQELREKQEVYVTIFTGGPLTRKIDIPGVDWVVEGHGGISETSLNMHIRPESVHMKSASDDLEARYVHDFGRDKWGPSIFPEINVDMTKSGHYGRATMATEEIGKKLFEMRVQALVEHIEYMKEFEVKPIKPSR
jgi:creatinine amidohydrolase